MRPTNWPWMAIGWLLVVVVPSRAEEPAAGNAPPPQAEASAPAKTNAELTRELEQTRQQVSALADALEAQKAEPPGLAEGEQSGQFSPTLRVFGFFDLTAQKAFLGEHDAVKLMMTDKSTFSIINTNLYVASQMTETVSALLELRLSFFPNGAEQANAQGAYQRIDTTVVNPVNVGIHRYGSVGIERVYLRYAPRPWFNLTAGRFLTPAGIWNIDHGSVVVIPVRQPEMISRELFPPAQTGLLLDGTFFPAEQWSLSWGLSLSNGRGPAEAVRDLDEQKAVGVKLKAAFERGPFSLSVSNYSYFGTYTADTRSASVDAATGTIATDTKVNERYEEWITVSDLLVKYRGLRLQVEHAYRWVQFLVPVLLFVQDPMNAFARTGGVNDPSLFAANYTADSLFSLLAYDLPWPLLGRSIRITPYVTVGYTNCADTNPYIRWDTYIGGLNLGFPSQVILKIEGGLVKPHEFVSKDGMTLLTAQLATLF